MANLVVRSTLPLRALPPSALRSLALVGFSAAFLAASGAFDTDKAAIVPRIGYWLAMSVAVAMLLESFHRWLSRRVAKPQWELRTWGLLILYVPLTAVALLLCMAFFGGPLTASRLGALLPGMVSISTAIQLLLSLRPLSKNTEDLAKSAQPEGPSRASLVQFLPLPLRRAKIHAVKAEDHYVRIYTSGGEALLRMRFQDAMSSLNGQKGVRPHRSWWVAEDEIVRLERFGRRAVLILMDGSRVPVSRKAVAGLGPPFRSGFEQ